MMQRTATASGTGIVAIVWRPKDSIIDALLWVMHHAAVTCACLIALARLMHAASVDVGQPSIAKCAGLAWFTSC